MLSGIENALFPIVSNINEYLSSYVLIILLIGVGVWYSIRTRFVQVRCFGEGMKKTFGNLSLKGGRQHAGMTSFQALATVIAAQVGTGNIVGASGAIPEGISKTNLAQTAFCTVFGEQFGAIFIAVCMFFFAFSTILSWNLFGKINANYLFGNKNPKTCALIYSIIAIVFIFIGSIANNDLVWELTDMFNNLMVLPNVIALFALTSIVIACVKEGKERRQRNSH